ncbi:hypothetical protein [Sunxiuqinia indica]|uniref:hypothetical protein n=1 Tax=Sunxiuqinia indica TaxID=2692584 RepID=UPI001357E52A|nr:hypothetical protein [Sunxiuqinia indica]
MSDFSNRCFVCEKEIKSKLLARNDELNLPVCEQCKGSDREKAKVSELRDGLADGFVCGCI